MSSRGSTRVLEFDENDQIIEMKDLKPKKASAVGVEFKPKRNTERSIAEKNRDKRNRKKERQLQEQLEREAKEKAKAKKEEEKRRKASGGFKGMMVETSE